MSRPDRRGFLCGAAGAAVALVPELEWAAALGLPEPLPVAVVGCGRQGRAILAELAKLDDVSVVAVCDTNPGRLRAGERRVRGALGFASHAELLARRPDVKAVFVATPTHRHAEVALDCLAAKKHVYCEAPLAATLEDCRALAAAARSAPCAFQTGLAARSNPIYQLARSFVRSGAIREVVGLRAQHHRKNTWRAPAETADEERELNWRLDPSVSLGLAGELGVHQFDVFHWFLDDYPVSVRGSGALLFHKDGRTLPDTEVVELAFAGGQRLVYEATLANSFEGEYELFAGSMGAVKLAWTAGWLFKEADAPTQGWEVYANRQQFHDEQGITLIADATKLAAQNKLEEGVGLPNPPLYYALVDFLRAATGDPRQVACSADEGLRATAIAILARRAIESGEELPIERALFEEAR